MKKISKSETLKKIKEFFSNLDNKESKEVWKIKRLAMKHNIKLGSLRKKFCKKCYSTRLKVLGIKKGIKRVLCEDCGYVMRWKV